MGKFSKRARKDPESDSGSQDESETEEMVIVSKSSFVYLFLLPLCSQCLDMYYNCGYL